MTENIHQYEKKRVWQGIVEPKNKKEAAKHATITIDDDLLHDVVGWAIGFEYELAAPRSPFAPPEDYFSKTIAYWCDQITAICPKGVTMKPRALMEDGYSNEEILSYISRGGIFRIHDAISHQYYELDKKKLEEGLDAALTAYQNNYLSEDYKPVEILVYDKETKRYKIVLNKNVADMAFQYALFGELRYDHDSVTMNGAIRVWVPKQRSEI